MSFSSGRRPGQAQSCRRTWLRDGGGGGLPASAASLPPGLQLRPVPEGFQGQDAAAPAARRPPERPWRHRCVRPGGPGVGLGGVDGSPAVLCAGCSSAPAGRVQAGEGGVDGGGSGLCLSVSVRSTGCLCRGPSSAAARPTRRGVRVDTGPRTQVDVRALLHTHALVTPGGRDTAEPGPTGRGPSSTRPPRTGAGPTQAPRHPATQPQGPFLWNWNKEGGRTPVPPSPERGPNTGQHPVGGGQGWGGRRAP